MALRPSSVSLRVPLQSSPASSLADGPDPESDLARAASPTVQRLLAIVVTDPLFESTTASSLVAELVDFAAACRLNYVASLVAESESDYPPPVGGECALGTNVLEDRQEDFECLAAPVPHLVAMLLAPEGDPNAPDIPTRALTQSVSTICTLLTSAQLSYMAAWLRRPPGLNGSFLTGTQWSLRRPVYGLRQAPRKWHDTLRTTLAALGFAPLTADPSLFLRTDTSLPPFYILVYIDDLVFVTADTEALAHVKSELQRRHTCHDLGPSALRLPVLLATVHSSAYRSLALSSTFRRVPVVTGLHFQPWLRLCSWWSTRSSSVLSSSCEAEIYAGAMAAQELCWLTYLLTNLGERPRSSPVLYVDNKAMIALCQEHRLEHRTKHIALRYFLARELQQHGQLHLAYVATRANTADIFSKAL
ncbi:unnamed protein product [Closterium sp. NIES-53]